MEPIVIITFDVNISVVVSDFTAPDVYGHGLESMEFMSQEGADCNGQAHCVRFVLAIWTLFLSCTRLSCSAIYTVSSLKEAVCFSCTNTKWFACWGIISLVNPPWLHL